MGRDVFTRKLKELEAQHPGLRQDLHRAIREGHRAHFICGRMQLMHNVRLRESFIERYVNYHNIRGGVEDDDPMEPTESPALPATGGANEGQGAPVPTPPDKPGRKPKAGSKNSERKKEVTKAHIIAALKVKIADMLRKAMADPSSDATVIIRILLLNEMTNEKLGFREEEYSKLVEAERKQAELQNKLEHEKFLRNLEKRKSRAQEEKLRNTIRTALEAEAQGESLSHQEIFKQISAVIGVGQPQVERVEPGGL